MVEKQWMYTTLVAEAFLAALDGRRVEVQVGPLLTEEGWTEAAPVEIVEGRRMRIEPPQGNTERTEEERIPVPRVQLMQLIELAEEALYVGHTEFSNAPTDEECGLMLSLYRLVGKEVPPFFFRTFEWSLD